MDCTKETSRTSLVITPLFKFLQLKLWLLKYGFLSKWGINFTETHLLVEIREKTYYYVLTISIHTTNVFFWRTITQGYLSLVFTVFLWRCLLNLNYFPCVIYIYLAHHICAIFWVPIILSRLFLLSVKKVQGCYYPNL
jgi:hypothetical protein